MSNISKSFFFGQAYDTELRSNQIIVIINISFYAMKSEEHIGSLKIYSFQFVNLLLIMRRVARYLCLATLTLSNTVIGHFIDLRSHAVITLALPCWSNRGEECLWKPLFYCTPAGITPGTTAQFSGGTDTLCRTPSSEGLTSA